MKVYLLTNEEKELIQNECFCVDSHFNPIQDIDNNWIISVEEVELCTNEKYNFVKNLPLIDYKPKPVIIP